MKNNMRVDIRFLHMKGTRELRALIRQQAERLRRFQLQGYRCEVVVDETNHWYKGRLFRVVIRLKVPGARLITAKASESCEDELCLDPSIRLAFDEIERQLQKKQSRIRRQAKMGIEGVAA